MLDTSNPATWPPVRFSMFVHRGRLQCMCMLAHVYTGKRL